MTTQKLRGYDIINTSALSKSTAFSRKEREELGLRGLLPHAVCSQALQEQRILENLRRKAYDIEKYIFLMALLERNEKLFYHTVIQNIDELMPLIYTPTVGQACKEFAHIFRKARGFYITPDDKGEIRNILDNWPVDDIRVIVVTDGERILGLGDLGANGMGIPIGKLSLYTACAGIHPRHCLPVMLDVGTNNEDFLKDPFYLGYPNHRIQGQPYLDLVEEFVLAVNDKFPKALIQFEDFLTPNAFKLLETYRDRTLCFNDDIQGTAAVSLAGVYASTRITNLRFTDLRIMFLGAGSAATGVGDLMCSAFMDQGLSHDEAANRLWFVDKKGLITSGRKDLMMHNIPYAHDHPPLSFIDAIKDIKPHILIGATGSPNTFTQEVIELMSSFQERPVIFALSNPTERAECTPEEAYAWSHGKALFASGSPFAKVTYQGQDFKPGQGNNAYIFPGMGLGATSCEASRMTDEMFLEAAKALSDQVTNDDLKYGTLYPPLSKIRTVSLEIATRIAQKAYEQGLAQHPEPKDMKTFIADQMYQTTY